MDSCFLKVGTVPLAKLPHEIDVEILERNRVPENRFQECFSCGALLSSSEVSKQVRKPSCQLSDKNNCNNVPTLRRVPADMGTMIMKWETLSIVHTSGVDASIVEKLASIRLA